ncbi:MAG: DUF481 domain-containing protein [Planctomycetota bacterium]|jgi:putative salt-induced outer membrane protein YdiY
MQHFSCLALVFLLLVATAARGDEIVLRSGDVIHGIIVDTTDEAVVIEHPELGRLTIARDSIVTVTGMDAPEKPPVADTTGDGDVAPDEAAEGPQQPTTFEEASPEWTLSVNLGGSLTNDDEGQKWNFNVGMNITRITANRESRFRLNYLAKVESKETTDNEGTALLDQTWFVPESPWHYFATPRYDYDAFRSWTHRVQVQGGVGYSLLTTERLRLTLRGGAGIRKDFGSENEPLRPEGIIGGAIDWRRSSLTSFKFSSYYLPSLENSDFRVLTNVDWSIKFAKASNLSFVTSLEWEYATDPDPGFPENNVTLTWGLQYSF